MREEGRKKRINTQIKDLELVKRKRLQIASAASKLFITKGYGQTTMREISKAAGLTIGNLYDYITTKQDVLFLVFDVFQSLWVSKLEKEGIFEISDPAEQLTVALETMLKLVNDSKDMVLLGYTETKLLRKDFLKVVLEQEGGLVKRFQDILERGAKKGSFKVEAPFLMANIIVYLLSLWPLRGWNLRKQYQVEEVNKHLIEFVKCYLMRCH